MMKELSLYEVQEVNGAGFFDLIIDGIVNAVANIVVDKLIGYLFN
ncbi:hypothetical protein [Pseudoalteromonas luteoviolacea]|nr:hypothetical protein [Pseudoalteromonas luteoviolacea]